MSLLIDPGRKSKQRIRKAKVMEKFIKLIQEYPVVMLADFTRVPANHFQQVRKELAPNIKFYVIKKRLAKKAAEMVERKGLNKLLERMPQNLVVILSKEDPFETYRKVTERKAEVFVKPGEVAEDDIVIQKGPTDLAPGPILTDLRAMNIPTKIQGGKIAIAQDVVIVRKGEVVSKQVADILKNLGIKPVKVGFKVTGAIDEEGILYLPEVLSVTKEEILENLSVAISSALTLAMEIKEINRYTIRPLTAKAVLQSVALATEIGWVTDKTIRPIITKAVTVARALKEKVNFE